jgi:SHS2 domain-containing protein
MAGYEILEHTADIGVRALGTTLEETFEQATRGLADIIGAWSGEEGEDVTVEVDAPDLGALLVDWLSEVLYLHDARDAIIAGVNVHSVEGGRAVGTITLGPRGGRDLEGTQVKAITYHQLAVEPTDGGWVARVFFDV